MKLSKTVFNVALVLCACMVVLFAVAGCSNGNGNDDKVTLNILGYGTADNGEGLTFKRICDEFMSANPDVVVKYELYYDDAYHARVSSRLSSGDIPDIAYMGTDERWGGAWKDSNQQVNNVPYYPSNIDASLVPDFFGNGVKPYLPLGGSNFCTVVGVNMQLLETIGSNATELNAALSSYDTFKSIAQKFNAYKAAHPNEGLIACLSTHGDDAWVWSSCVLSALIARTSGDANWIKKAVAGTEHFTDTEFVNAVAELRKWVTDGILDAGSVNTSDGQGKTNFKNGKYLMYIDGQWGFGRANFEDLSSHIKLIAIPAIEGSTAGMRNSMASAWQTGYGITRKGTSDSKVLDAAKRWMAYFNSETEIVKRLRDGGISSAILKNFTLPSDMDPLIGEKATLSSLPYCCVIDSYLSGTANNTLNAGLKNVVSGTKTASALAQEVQTAFNAQASN